MAIWAVRPTRYNFQVISAETIQYHSVGPFVEGEVLESLKLDFMCEGAGTIAIAPVLAGVRYATLVSVQQGADLIAESDLLFAGTRSLQFTPAAAGMVSLELVLNVVVSSGPRWMHYAVSNQVAVGNLEILVGVTVAVAPVVVVGPEELEVNGEPAIRRIGRVSPVARPPARVGAMAPVT